MFLLPLSSGSPHVRTPHDIVPGGIPHVSLCGRLACPAVVVVPNAIPMCQAVVGVAEVVWDALLAALLLLMEPGMVEGAASTVGESTAPTTGRASTPTVVEATTTSVVAGAMSPFSKLGRCMCRWARGLVVLLVWGHLLPQSLVERLES